MVHLIFFLLVQPSGHLPHLLQGALRVGDLNSPREGEHPGEKGRAGRHVHLGGEVVRAVRLRLDAVSKAVYDVSISSLYMPKTLEA